MHYYEVIPATNNFHGKEPLTYSYGGKLIPGQIVQIELRGAVTAGIVIEEAKRPSFKTVEITKVLDGLAVPRAGIGLIKWMSAFYPSPLGAIAQLFSPGFLTKLDLNDIIPDQKPDKLSGPRLPKLTDEQAKAYATINKPSAPANSSFILHGITGSGKTRLYIELARNNLAQGKSVLVLTPEISLTAPIAEQFKKALGDKVTVNHSSLTQKQRILLWHKAFQKKEPVVVIGPRSSLFLPLNDIGLIVVDEFHEPAYKQESRPFYHANRVASMLAKLSSAKLIFGSATPPVADYYLARRKEVPLVKMVRSAITGKELSTPSVVIDLLKDSEKSGYPLISKTLVSHLSETLKKGEQAMLFINKRGSARSIACLDCGHKELCDNCDLPMVYHADQHLVRCHTCGFGKQPPAKCPACGSLEIYFSSPGTKAITESLSKLFPQANIVRFDKDNKKSERLENNYEKAVNEIDIIVGTQIIAKGHDLPRLSLVAMLLADSGLDFPDYTSEERSYQLIKQLSGRVNRGHRDGVFLIQTFAPSGKLIDSALNGSWDDFYNQEIKQREKYGFPPFYSVVKIESARKSKEAAERSLVDLIHKLNISGKKIQILGPSPSFIEKKSSKWHWQILLKSRSRSALVETALQVPSSFKIDIDPNNFL